MYIKNLKKKYQEKWENAYLRVKNARTSRVLRRALHPGQYSLTSHARLRFAMSAECRQKFLGPPPPDQILDPLVEQVKIFKVFMTRKSNKFNSNKIQLSGIESFTRWLISLPGSPLSRPCLALCLTPCLTPCLAPCLTPCLIPCLTPVSPLSHSLCGFLSCPLSHSLSRPLCRSLGPWPRYHFALDFSVPTNILGFKVPSTMWEQGARQGARGSETIGSKFEPKNEPPVIWNYHNFNSAEVYSKLLIPATVELVLKEEHILWQKKKSTSRSVTFNRIEYRKKQIDHLNFTSFVVFLLCSREEVTEV